MKTVIKFQLLTLLGFSLWALAEQALLNYENAMITVLSSAPEAPDKTVVKTDAEWASTLSPIEYHVLRKSGTEPPNGSIYKQFKAQGGGTYYCAGCGAELFSAEAKFDSGSGWPSFYSPSVQENITLDIDYKIGYKRIEARCKTCDGHLGHVFEGEGYDTPTDKRYCINGVCLHYLPKEKEEK